MLGNSVFVERVIRQSKKFDKPCTENKFLQAFSQQKLDIINKILQTGEKKTLPLISPLRVSILPNP
jgi:hypothetical protein